MQNICAYEPQQLAIHCFMAYAAICDPPCEHGVCVANNSCNCAPGYSGSLCSEAGGCIKLAVNVLASFSTYL